MFGDPTPEGAPTQQHPHAPTAPVLSTCGTRASHQLPASSVILSLHSLSAGIHQDGYSVVGIFCAGRKRIRGAATSLYRSPKDPEPLITKARWIFVCCWRFFCDQAWL